MGRRFSDATVQTGLKLWPFKVVPGRGDKPMVAASYKGKQKQLTAEELASMLLSKMKAEAEAYLGGQVKNAVITGPALFDVLQRRATKRACAIPGLDVLGVIHEPTAAAVAYGIHESAGDKNRVTPHIRVKATDGDPHLGGEDFNSPMVEHFVAQFKERQGADFYFTITRDQFDDLNLDLFCKCLEPIKKCLTAAKMDRSSVADVVLVGGSTRIPRVRRLIQDLFDGKELRKDINPEEEAARGPAIAARRDSLQNLLVLDATPRSLGGRRRHGSDDTKERERPRARENTLLGELELPAAQNRGKPAVKLPVSVCFSIDADGVFTVSARDKVNGHRNQKYNAIEAEKRKVDDALSAVEEMIQQVQSDQASREFQESLEELMIVCGKRDDA
ncbi:hypothetical protein E2562_021532 [Oryza meyeriana var. granulata]|uniref:Uncharacterized protein n=1 Tax=Oryza meyeriana var. granulata TaxID=110450 RepID=A0A6G1DZD3_9ORYZ|nr:hypothetical protein E2562_021532 [Oryza meyeriana var. granulata]